MSLDRCANKFSMTIQNKYWKIYITRIKKVSKSDLPNSSRWLLAENVLKMYRDQIKRCLRVSNDFASPCMNHPEIIIPSAFIHR